MTLVQRDLSFRPVENRQPSRLTHDQITTYNRDGYLTPIDIFDPAEAAANRRYFDGLLARFAGHGAYAINCYQARYRGIWDLCTEPRILDVVEDLVGPDIVCWASHYFCKMPFDDKVVPWHQDASFWQLSPARTVTVWLAIDDADETNAAMRFIPGSHDRGHLDWRPVGGATVLDQELVGVEALGEPVSNTLRAGQISVHADMLAHGSTANASARRRCGLTLRYCPPAVTIVDDAWARGVEAIVCRGRDASGRWRHHDRPADDAVSPGEGPRNIGGN